MMDSSHPSPLPPPPRAITPRVRRRSWHERPVRVWLIVLVLVGSAAAFFTWVRVAETLRERAIIFRGEEVIATVTAIEGSTIPNRKEANVSGLRVVLSYQTAGGTEVRDAWGRLQPSEPPQIAVGDTIHVRIDPLKPENWTTRRTPEAGRPSCCSCGCWHRCWG
ncbi:MAG: DUF3592 domain-containing protein [Phycisphaerae bacterium]|nr:DUF3592 domain-containing protein [Phycisphaerae bacterium]MDW8260982.1 hypothetical protein [Phycisphaerales bacterium]